MKDYIPFERSMKWTSYLVRQHCRGCGVDYYTSRVDGDWKKVGEGMHELTLKGRPCRCCRGLDVTGPTFDNGGMLVMEEEVQL